MRRARTGFRWKPVSAERPPKPRRAGTAEEILLSPHPSIRITKTKSGGTVTTKVNTLHPGGLGSVRAVTDATGAVVERTTYRPFGEEVAQQQALSLPETKGFIGERFDDTSGLQYLNARYYDPKLAMFIQPDWWEVWWPGVGTNRYSYSFNDPVNGRDPSGHWAEEQADGNLSGWQGDPTHVSNDPDWGPNRVDRGPETRPNNGGVSRSSGGNAGGGNGGWGGLLDWHYDRNLNQSFPPSVAEFRRALEAGQYVLAPEVPAYAHQMGTNPGGANPALNTKYITVDGQEGIYDVNGSIVLDDVNMGTFNYVTPDGIIGSIGHFAADVAPYVAFGNSPEDPTTVFERAGALVGGGLGVPNQGYRGDINITSDQRRQYESSETWRMIEQTREFWSGGN